MNILIAGASGGIAQALGQEFKNRGHKAGSISRSPSPEWSQQHLQADCRSGTSVKEIKSWLKDTAFQPELVIQCAGVLHNHNHMPEKSLSRISTDWLLESIETNLCTHIHLAQAIDPLVNRNNPIRWASLSALVGSISENHLGGWHSYRMSKSALNMFVRNLSIEWQRRSAESIAVALHPGTTDTALSKPFQKNIASDKLYTLNTTGKRLTDVLENLTPEQNGKLLHWDGEIVSF